MPSHFQMLFGPAAAADLRFRYAERAAFFFRLSDIYLVQYKRPTAEDHFQGATQLFDVLEVLVEQPVRLSEEDLFKFFRAFAPPREGLISGVDIAAIVRALYPLNAVQIFGVIHALCDAPGRVPASFVRDLILGWVAPAPGGRNMSAAQFSGMVTYLRETLTRSELQAAFAALRPCDGNVAYRIYSTLCTGGGRLDGTQFGRVIGWLCPAGTGLLRYTAAEVNTLVQDLCTGEQAVNGEQLRDIVQSMLSPNAPARALTLTETRQLMAHLRAPPPARVTPLRLHELMATACDRGEHGERVILNPAWLHDAARGVYRTHSFSRILNECVLAGEREMKDLRNQLVGFYQAQIPAARWAMLLRVLSRLPTADRYRLMKSFVTDGAAAIGEDRTRWETSIMVNLSAFLDAGRAPHPPVGGAMRNRFAFTDYEPERPLEGDISWEATAGTDNVRLYRGSLNAICNSHTLAHCDFTQRLSIAAATFSFFGVTVGRPQVRTLIEGFGFTQFRRFMDRNRRYCEGPLLNHHFGLRFGGMSENTRVYSVDHLYPVPAAFAVSREALLAISHLFDLEGHDLEV